MVLEKHSSGSLVVQRPTAADRGTDRDTMLIVEDHAMVRQGLILAMRETGRVRAFVEAESLDEAVALAHDRDDLALAIIDLGLADADGSAGVGRLADALTGTPLLVVSGSSDPSVVVDCIRAGARGFVPKSAGMDVLENAVLLILASGSYVPMPRGVIGPAPLAGDKRPTPVADLLTGRQRDVFHLLLAGQSNKEIARSLGILEGTVKVHVRAIMQKLGVSNRTQVAVAAARAGYFGRGCESLSYRAPLR